MTNGAPPDPGHFGVVTSTTPPVSVVVAPVLPLPDPDPAPAPDLPCPPKAPIPWYESQRFIALIQATTLSVLGWAITAFAANDWSTWRAIVITVGSNLLVQLNDWWSPKVHAPAVAGLLGANRKSDAAMKAFKADGTQGS